MPSAYKKDFYHSRDSQGFRSCVTRRRVRDQIYISYYITISQGENTFLLLSSCKSGIFQHGIYWIILVTQPDLRKGIQMRYAGDGRGWKSDKCGYLEHTVGHTVQLGIQRMTELNSKWRWKPSGGLQDYPLC
jgi:hypothetical protein